MRVLLLFVLCYCSILLTAQEYYIFKQGNYWFTKWNTNEKVDANAVSILMDTSHSKVENDYNKELAAQIVKQLRKRDIKSNYAFFGEKYDTNSFVIRFKTLLRGRVKLSIFADGLPMCRKYDVKLPFDPKVVDEFYCPRVLSLSTESEEVALRKSSKRLAKLIKRTIQ